MKKYLLVKPLFLFLLSTSLAQSLDAQRIPTSTGVVMPNRTVTLAAKIVGRVITVNVEEGDLVEANDLLIDIGDAELRAELAGAEARLKQEELNQKHTKKLADRVRSLYEQQAASAEAMDEADFKYAATKESVASARAYVARAQAMLDETKIKAPFAGVIIKKRVEIGDVTEPGEPLLVLEDHDTLKFRTSVNEQDIPHISRGQKITITIDALNDLELEATVSKIIPSGDLITHEFIVEALLPQQDKLYPGMFGKAKFIR